VNIKTNIKILYPEFNLPYEALILDLQHKPRYSVVLYI